MHSNIFLLNLCALYRNSNAIKYMVTVCFNNNLYTICGTAC